MSAVRRIAILCALEEEAVPLFAGQGNTRSVRHLPVRSLETGGKAVHIAICGIGKVNAALATGLLVAETGADMLMMSGTCGQIAPVPDADGPQAYWIAEALQHDYGAEVPGDFLHFTAGAFPIGEAHVEPYRAISDPGSDLRPARLASGDRFLACPDRARFLAQGLSAQLVDMEVAAVAQVAETLGLPWAAIKATTDSADDASGGDFQANLARAAGEAAVALERVIAALP